MSKPGSSSPDAPILIEAGGGAARAKRPAIWAVNLKLQPSVKAAAEAAAASHGLSLHELIEDLLRRRLERADLPANMAGKSGEGPLLSCTSPES